MEDKLRTIVADGNIHTMPTAGPEHEESVECWCEPVLTFDGTDRGGVKQYLHKLLH